MDNFTSAKSIFEAEDFQPLLDRLADDVVFKATIPEGTPISGEFRGKQAVVDYFATLRIGRAEDDGCRSAGKAQSTYCGRLGAVDRPTMSASHG
jgi:hypothetical protein